MKFYWRHNGNILLHTVYFITYFSIDDWNEKYQRLVDNETKTFEQSIIQALNLADLVGSFLAAAESCVRTIVDEYHIPDDQKTISPIPMDPSLPPEEKEEIYIANGLLFKFTVDNTGKLDEETMATIANHELKGSKAYLEANIPGIHTTLSSIIDYNGMRMIAMAFFPAGNDLTSSQLYLQW